MDAKKAIGIFTHTTKRSFDVYNVTHPDHPFGPMYLIGKVWSITLEGHQFCIFSARDQLSVHAGTVEEAVGCLIDLEEFTNYEFNWLEGIEYKQHGSTCKMIYGKLPSALIDGCLLQLEDDMWMWIVPGEECSVFSFKTRGEASIALIKRNQKKQNGS